MESLNELELGSLVDTISTNSAKALRDNRQKILILIMIIAIYSIYNLKNLIVEMIARSSLSKKTNKKEDIPIYLIFQLLFNVLLIMEVINFQNEVSNSVLGIMKTVLRISIVPKQLVKLSIIGLCISFILFLLQQTNLKTFIFDTITQTTLIILSQDLLLSFIEDL